MLASPQLVNEACCQQHCAVLNCAVKCITQQCITVQCIAVHCIGLSFPWSPCTIGTALYGCPSFFDFTGLHFNTLDIPTPNRAMYCITLHFTAVHSTTLQFTSLQYNTLLYTTLHFTTLKLLALYRALVSSTAPSCWVSPRLFPSCNSSALHRAAQL